MVEIRFYHLRTQSVEYALPQILSKALKGGHRIIVKTADTQTAEKLNEHLWTFRPDSFLPHGTKNDGHGAHQPVWITNEDDNPNNADILVLTDQTGSEQIEQFKLCCEIFDGRDEHATKAARAKWKTYKDSGFELTYWQQNEHGGWDKKAA